MSPAASPSERPASGGYLSIGQVLARLTPEFANLTTSKLRFLEDQGIVTPTRTASGYRRFSSHDVERLRLALTLQRDRYLPLAVIREHLDERDAQGDATPPPPSIVAAPRRYRRVELITAAGATASLLSDAVSAGLVPAAESFDERALTMLRTLVALAEHGIHPRHLRTLKQSADRDVALIETALTPLMRRTDARSRARAAEVGPELMRRLDDLRSAYVHAALARMLS